MTDFEVNFSEQLFNNKAARVLDDLMAEPFLAALPRYDTEELPAEGLDGGDCMHTWYARCLLDAWCQTGFNSVLFQDREWVRNLCRMLKAAQNGGAYSEMLTRQYQLIARQDLERFAGKSILNPLLMNSRSSDKVVVWLRRSITSSLAARGAEVTLVNMDLDLLMCVSACCDPAGRQSILFG